MSRYLYSPPPWPLTDETIAVLESCPNRENHRAPPIGANGAVDTSVWRQRRCVCDRWAIWERKSDV